MACCLDLIIGSKKISVLPQLDTDDNYESSRKELLLGISKYLDDSRLSYVLF